MKKLFIILAAIAVLSCRGNQKTTLSYAVDLQTIAGCEYVIVYHNAGQNGTAVAVTHHAACRNHKAK